MADINALLAANRAAVDDLITAAERAGGVWTMPRAPGKWSPSQVVEHVARVLEESANVVSGAPSKLPTLPAFLHPLIRILFFNRVIRKGVFPKAKTNKPLNPVSGPATPAEARARLDAALVKFDRACRARAASGQPVLSAAFGRVSVEDYARFEELHTRHHRQQMPTAS
jgi:hypothetical protein